MSNSKVVRIAPTRSGRLAATPWRFFAQGDNYYAATVLGLKTGMKCTFHDGGLWKCEFDTHRQPLCTQVRTDGVWQHALSVSFLLPTGVRRLHSDAASKKTVQIEVPQDHTLRIDVFASITPPVANAAGKIEVPTAAGWADRQAIRLRSGNMVVVCSRVLAMDSGDRRRLRQCRSMLPTIPSPEQAVQAEFYWYSSHPGSGNWIFVVPYPESHLMGATAPAPSNYLA